MVDHLLKVIHLLGEGIPSESLQVWKIDHLLSCASVMGEIEFTDIETLSEEVISKQIICSPVLIGLEAVDYQDEWSALFLKQQVVDDGSSFTAGN